MQKYELGILFLASMQFSRLSHCNGRLYHSNEGIETETHTHLPPSHRANVNAIRAIIESSE